MTAVQNVLIVGGGVGGLTAATALRQQGIAVDLVEVNPDHSVYGVGIIQPNNVLRALDRIGLADACVAEGGAFPGWKIFDREGNPIFEAPNSNRASPRHPPVNGITRPILQRILLDAARASGTAIRIGITIANMEDRGDEVEVRFTDGTRGSYDLVVGSDGLYSKFRNRLFPSSLTPQGSGQSVWRYNFRRRPEVDWGAVYYGQTTKVGIVPMSPSLMYIFLVTKEAPNQRFADAELAAEMQARLEEYGGLIASLREEIVDPAAVVYRPLEHLLLPAPWYKGRAMVIGDAAHATTPHLAQGAAMAIEDAVLLGELLGRDGPLEPLLEEFMRRRFERAKYVIDTSRQLAEWEVAQWTGKGSYDAEAGALLGRATEQLMEAY